MANPYKQLKEAADLLEKQAQALDAAATQIEKSKADLDKAKTAATKAQTQAKTASASPKLDQAKVGQMAKTAAASLQEAGLISTSENADVFAAEVMDHQTALAKIAQLAKVASVPRRAQVVEDDHSTPAETADSVYEKRARAALSQLKIG